MIFTAPWGLLALLAVPAIITIHLFRKRFPPRPIAGLFLWRTLEQTPEGGGRITRLPVTASLILECLAAVALALIISGARLQPAGESEHLIVLLDDSASMAATNAQGESPRDRAARRVLAQIEELGRRTSLTLIQSGERPSVLLGPAALSAAGERALEGWLPQSPHHSLTLGLRLAREIAGNSGKLMVVSDAPPTARGGSNVEGVLWVSVGEPLANTGITAAQRTLSTDEGKAAVSLTLENYSNIAARRRLSVIAAIENGKEVLTKDLDVPPGLSSLNLPLPTGLPALRVQLSPDALESDNHVTLVEPRPQIVGVQNDLPEGRGRQALAKALGTLAGVTRSESGHLRFMLATDLDKPPESGLWQVGFGEPPGAMRGSGEVMDFIGPFVPEKRHPLLQGVTLGGIVWTGAAPLALGVHPLVSAGDRPLIALRGARPEDGILFNINLDNTNLVRSPDWPILISNIVEMRRQNLPGPERWNYRVGEWVRLRLEHDPKGRLYLRCGAIERDLPAGRLLEFVVPIHCAGAGGLLQIMEDRNVLVELGANFLDQEETRLEDRAAGEAGKYSDTESGLRAESGPASDPLFWLLLATVGGAVLANWCWLAPGKARA